MFRSAWTLLALVALAAPAMAQDGGDFVVRLGTDTTGFERYTRSGNRLEVEQVGRVPRVFHRKYTYEISGQGTKKASATIRTPDAPAPVKAFQQLDTELRGDSAFTTIVLDTTTRTVRVAVPKGTVFGANSAPWAVYEQQTMKLAKSKADTLGAPLYFLGGTGLSSITVKKLGKDSMVVATQNDTYHARVDAAGRIQGVRPIRGTQAYSVDRAAKLDIPALAAAFAAREKAAGQMGALSTRDTVRASAAGAAFLVDYSRPSKRGRAIYGALVPYGQVWRTGANTATMFRTDKNLQFGDKTLPAGSYSLFTIPEASGWTLIVNSETNQPGTAHNAAKDVFRIPMTVSALSEPVERFTISVTPGEGNAGTLNLDWDTTRASAGFTVAP